MVCSLLQVMRRNLCHKLKNDINLFPPQIPVYGDRSFLHLTEKTFARTGLSNIFQGFEMAGVSVQLSMPQQIPVFETEC